VAKQVVRESAVIRILPLVAIIGLMLYTFFDVLATDRRRFTSLSKGTWLLVALLPVIGAMLWIVVGKPRRPRRSGDSVISLHRRDRPIAPDDDPEFLRRLDEQAWRAKRESAKRESAKRESAKRESARPSRQQQAAPESADSRPQDIADPEPGPAAAEGPAETGPEAAADQVTERAPGEDDDPPTPGGQAKPAE
jgi:hypothetical protein